MSTQHCPWIILTLLTLLVTDALSLAPSSPFPCTGGSIYFTAHTVDSLLFQNPDLSHDLYVFKCITTVVFAADTGGEVVNDTRIRELERGLEDAYRFMSGLSPVVADGTRPVSDVEEPAPADTSITISIGKYNVSASPLLGLSNVQIIFLRLPKSTYYGHGFSAYHEESLKELYSAENSRLTATDGSATYTVRDLKGVIATVLHERRADSIHLLNYLASLTTGQDNVQIEYADRIVSAKLVMDVINEESIGARVLAHGCDEIRNLDGNLNTPDYIKKVNAFFEYAKHDPDMCQSLDECARRLQNAGKTANFYNEGDYIFEFLKREYYVT